MKNGNNWSQQNETTRTQADRRNADTSYVNRGNQEYLDQLFSQYENSPDSVPLEWQRFFEGVQFAQSGSHGLSSKELDVYNLIQAYRNYGHLEANTNPLEPAKASSDLLNLKKYNLSDKDLNFKFQIGAMIGKPNSTLGEIISHLRKVYCNTLTVQCAEALPEVRDWFTNEFEKKSTTAFNAEEKKQILSSITRADALEKFLHTRYVGTKRFSVEGADALLPMLDHLAMSCTQVKAKEIMVGMAHRGRINVLVNFMGKGLEYIFADLNGLTEHTEPIEDFDGDVKYHLGYSTTKDTPNGPCHVSLAYNPSHLEAVNPVVLGMARAAQRRRKDTQERKSVIPVLIHGDAAFAGQGVVLETFQMSQVKGYTVGGTIHVVIDNQVGFTTSPVNARSAKYSTDVAKVIACPVIHVNGDDAEACVRAMDIAMRFRQQTGKDIVINLTCYRRFGHNEGDEPAYTQPLMYEKIKTHATLREIYGKKLIAESSIDEQSYDHLYNQRMDYLQKIYDETKKNPPKLPPPKLDGFWKGFRKAKHGDLEVPVKTQFDLTKLQEIGKLTSEFPSHFNPHPKLIKLLESRKNMALGKEPIDWGMGELLAYGSLLSEGNSIRITGQDCVRGTFTHRHAGLYDTKTNEVYMALDYINSENVEFCVYDSILSEYAVMGFEYGNSACDPTFLTIWEAQFGDFANGAQIIIDQFLSSGEAKWMQMTGLVLLLPHGFEGQGPEHSSARLERFLQLCAQNNMQVMNLTTPAQMFHALRRQIRREFRKPLVIMTPKKLLRYPRAVSSLEELAKGQFMEVIADNSVIDKSKVQTLLFCSGKIYYDLIEEKEKNKNESIAIIRVEQLYPFPTALISSMLKSFPNLKNAAWVQEEPKNMGAFQHIYFKFMDLFDSMKLNLKLKYVGRSERSSPAVGSIYRHNIEQKEIIEQAFSKDL